MNRRALAPVLGFVILIGITAIASVGLFVVGATITDGAQSQTEAEQVERSMAQMAQTADTVAQEDVGDGSFSIEGNEDALTYVNESAGHITINYTGTADPLFDASLGAFVYEAEDGSRMAYQGGGVWRLDESGDPVMVEPPKFEYRNGLDGEATLTFPVTRVRGNYTGDGSSEVSLVRTNQTDLFPERPGQNPLEGGQIFVTIESDYCSGWETYLEERTDTDVNERCSGSGTHTDVGELRFELTVPSPSIGEVTEAVAAPNVNIGGSPGTEIDGDVLVNDSSTVDDSQVTGDVEEADGGVSLPPIDGEIDDKVSDCGSFVHRDQITSPGTHCLDSSSVGDGLEVHPSAGEVTLVFNGDITVSGNDDGLTVHDGDQVEVYIDGGASINSMHALVGNPDDPGQTIIYAKDDITISGTPSEGVNAVIYAPDSTVDVNSANTELVGAVFANTFDIGGQATVEFDEDSLDGMTLDVGTNNDDAEVYYLHVTETVLEARAAR